MLALHARRSAASIDAWADRHPGRGLAVVLTGTDLYPDISSDPVAMRSLALAQALVVLQDQAVEALPGAARGKAIVIYQSTPARKPLARPKGFLRAVMVGHLRAVKDPGTLFAAARQLAGRSDIRIDHIGDAKAEPRLGELAAQTAALVPTYRWLGALPHTETRRRIQQAHVLVHTSTLEGGAHVIMEAVRSATPVLASRVAGNVGMLGADYAGYFPAGDAQALAGLLAACRESQADADPTTGMLARLRAQCDSRAALFDAEAERASLLHLLTTLERTT